MDDETGAQSPESTGTEVEYAETPEPQSPAEGAAQAPGEPGAGGVTPEGAPQPEPAFTRAQFDEAMSGVAGQYQERFDQLGRYMRTLADQVAGLRQPAQPKPQQPQLTPDLPEFNEIFAGGDSYKMHQLMKARDEHHAKRYEELNNQFQAMSGRLQQDKLTNQYFEYYNNLVNQACETHPVFKDPFCREQLEHYVAAKANQNRVRGVRTAIDVAGIAKRMSDSWTAMADRRYQEKITGTQPLPPGQQPQPPAPGTRPPPGTPTRPGAKPRREVKDLSDLEAACAETLPGIHAQAAQEMGWDDEG